jgi:hypothetical protein
MTYELWDTETNNIVGAYESESDALAVVRRAMSTHGVGYADELALLREDIHGNVETIAIGVALAELARTVATEVASSRN